MPVHAKAILPLRAQRGTEDAYMYYTRGACVKANSKRNFFFGSLVPCEGMSPISASGGEVHRLRQNSSPTKFISDESNMTILCCRIGCLSSARTSACLRALRASIFPKSCVLPVTEWCLARTAELGKNCVFETR